MVDNQLIRNYPHKPFLDDLERVREDAEEELDESITALTSGTFSNFRRWKFLIDYSIEVIALRYAFKEDLGVLRNRFKTVSGYLAKAIAVCNHLNRGALVRWYSVAAIAGDETATCALLSLSDEQLEHPSYINTDYMRSVARTVRAFHNSDREATLLGIQLVEAASSKATPSEQRIYGTLISLIAAILQINQTVIQAAIEQRAQQFAKDFRRGEDNYSPEGLLDINALGIIARGRISFGVKVLAESVYIPRGLVEG